MATAWEILTSSSRLPPANTAWDHLNNLAGNNVTIEDPIYFQELDIEVEVMAVEIDIPIVEIEVDTSEIEIEVDKPEIELETCNG